MSDIALQETISRLSALVRQVADEHSCPAELHDSSRFIEDIGMESINRLMLVTLVEQEFGVNLETHMASLLNLLTIGDTARFLLTLKAPAQA